MKSIAVVYLSRRGNDPRFTAAFLNSLRAHPAGRDYDLIMVLKGYECSQSDPVLIDMRSQLNMRISEIRIRDEIFPIQVYKEIAEQLVGFQRVMFLVSYSRILADNWLQLLEAPLLASSKIGVTGATGGFEPALEMPFPNVNVRTTGFLIDRSLFLDLDFGRQTEKMDGNRFEAGPHSMTRQLEQRGLSPRLVDRWGRAWEPNDWPKSRTFRSGNQEGLLIADNHTFKYAMATTRKRGYLASLNWGSEALVSRSTFASRLKARIAWSYPRLSSNLS